MLARVIVAAVGALFVAVAPAFSEDILGPTPAPSAARATPDAVPSHTPSFRDRMDAYYASHPEAVHLTDDVTPPEFVGRTQPKLDCLKGKTVQLGVHVFAITVAADGSVRDPQYLSDRDQAVAKCYLPQLRRFRYKPALKGGHPVSVILIITLDLDG